MPAVQPSDASEFYSYTKERGYTYDSSNAQGQALDGHCKGGQQIIAEGFCKSSILQHLIDLNVLLTTKEAQDQFQPVRMTIHQFLIST